MNGKITQQDWAQYFPFPKPREDQVQFIDFALNEFIVRGKRFVIGELPTGIGKSAIAVTIARYLAVHDPPPPEAEYGTGAYILTTQKILQEQYMDDFRNFDMESIKSSSNYQCRFYVEQTCAESLRVLKKLESRLTGTPFHRQCMGSCAYKEQKSKFLAAKMGVTNFSYFLAETMYGGALTPRQLLVIDEAHNVEQEVAKFVAVRIEPGSEREVVKISVPSFAGQEAAFAWIRDVYKPAAQKHKDKVAKRIERVLAKDEKPTRALLKAMKENEHLDKHICKVNRFLESYNPYDWVYNQDEKSVEFKPVDISKHTEFHLFKHAPRALVLSATILDHEFYCETLGIRREDVGFMSLDSPFPVSKRPIHYLPVGRMSAGEIERTLPNMVEAVKAILEQHPNEKGIIHTHNYRITQALRDGIRAKRMLFQTSGDIREKILWEHSRSDDATVLVSPSMTEGVDLRDDLSRFQIFCKIPFPYMGDEYVKRKMARSPKWYPFVTARTVVQAAGRSIRNECDWATTYILDSSWEWFFKKNQEMFPGYFKNALVT